MKKNQKISTFLIIVTIVTFGTFFFINNIIRIEAVKKDGGLLEDYDKLKELVGDIKNHKFNDDQITLNDIKNSSAYQDADEDMQDCIKLAAKVGHNLGDYEIVHCFKNENYFKEKYSKGNNSSSTSWLPIQAVGRIATANAMNVTSSDANVTRSTAHANMTGSEGNMTGSSADANITASNATSSKYE